MTNSAYQRNYFAANKTSITAKRNLRRAAMTEEELEVERQKARNRVALNRAKTRELISTVKELNTVFETLTSSSVEGVAP